MRASTFRAPLCMRGIREVCSGHLRWQVGVMHNNLKCCCYYLLSSIAFLFHRLYLKLCKHAQMHGMLNKMKGPSSVTERKKFYRYSYRYTNSVYTLSSPHCIINLFLTQTVEFHPLRLMSGNLHLLTYLLLKKLPCNSVLPLCCRGPDCGPPLPVAKWNSGSPLMSSDTASVPAAGKWQGMGPGLNGEGRDVYVRKGRANGKQRQEMPMCGPEG